MSYRERSSRAISQTAIFHSQGPLPRSNMEDSERDNFAPPSSGALTRKRVSISDGLPVAHLGDSYRDRSSLRISSHPDSSLNRYFEGSDANANKLNRQPHNIAQSSESPEPTAVVSSSTLPPEFLAQHPYYYSEATAPYYSERIRQNNPLAVSEHSKQPQRKLNIEIPKSPTEGYRLPQTTGNTYREELIQPPKASSITPESEASPPQEAEPVEDEHPSLLSDRVQPESDGSIPLQELHQSLVLLWIPALNKSRKLDAHFVPTTEGKWRVRKLLLRVTNTVTPVYKTDAKGNMIESFAVSRIGEISIRKYDDKQTLRFSEKVHHLTTVSSFSIPEQYPVPLLSDTVADDTAARFEAELLTDDEDEDNASNEYSAAKQHSLIATRSSGGIDEIRQHLASAEKERQHIRKMRKDKRHVRFTCGDIGLRIVSESGDVYPIAMSSANEVETWLASLQDMIRQHEHDAAFSSREGSPVFQDSAKDLLRSGTSVLNFTASQQDWNKDEADVGSQMTEKDRLLAITSAMEKHRPDASQYVAAFLARDVKKTKGGNIVKSQSSIDEPPNGGLVKFLKGEGDKTSNWRLWPKVPGQPGVIAAFKLSKSTINKPFDVLRQAIGSGSLHHIDAEDCDLFIEYPWASTVIALTHRKKQQTLYFECSTLDNRIAWEQWLRLMGANKILSLEEMNAMMDDTKSSRSGWQAGDEDYTDSQSIQTTTLRPDSFAAIGRFQQAPNGRSMRRRASASGSYEDLYRPFDAAEGHLGESPGLGSSDMWRDEEEGLLDGDEVYLKEAKHGIFNESEIQSFRQKHSSPWISGRPVQGGFAVAFGVGKGSPLLKENVRRHDELTGVESALFDHIGDGEADTNKAGSESIRGRSTNRSDLSEDAEGYDFSKYNDENVNSVTLDPASLLRVGGRTELQEAALLNVEKEEQHLRQLLQNDYEAGEGALERALREAHAEREEKIKFRKLVVSMDDSQLEEDTERKRIELAERKMWRRLSLLAKGALSSPAHETHQHFSANEDEVDDADLVSDAMKWRQRVAHSPTRALVSPTHDTSPQPSKVRTSHFLRDTLKELGGAADDETNSARSKETEAEPSAAETPPSAPVANDLDASPYHRRMRLQLQKTNTTAPIPENRPYEFSDAVKDRSSLYALPMAALPTDQPTGGAYFAPDSTIALANAALENKRKEEIRAVIRRHQMERDRTKSSVDFNGIGSPLLSENNHSPTASSLILGGIHGTDLSSVISPEERRLHDMEQRLLFEENQRLSGTDRIASNLTELMREADQIGLRSTETRAAYTAGQFSPLKKEQIAQLRKKMLSNHGNHLVDVKGGPAVNFDTAFGRSAQLIYSIVDGQDIVDGADELMLEAMSDKELERALISRRQGADYQGRIGKSSTRLTELSRVVSNTTLQCPRRHADDHSIDTYRQQLKATPQTILAAGQLDRVPIVYNSAKNCDHTPQTRSTFSSERFTPRFAGSTNELSMKHVTNLPSNDSTLLSASPIPTGVMSTSLMDNAFNFSYGFAGFGHSNTEAAKPNPTPDSSLPASINIEPEERMTPYLAAIQRASRQGPHHTAVVAASAKPAPSAAIAATTLRCAICGEDKSTVTICKTTGRKHVTIGTLGIGANALNSLSLKSYSERQTTAFLSPVDYSTTSAITLFDTPTRAERIERRNRLI